MSFVFALVFAATSPDAGIEFAVLPGEAPVGMDYLAFDAATQKLWVPAGNTAKIDVLDTRTGKIESIAEQATLKKGERVMGVSSATVGEGSVYVGNRADSSVCAYDSKTYAKQSCVKLEAQPDGLAYVATRKEVWATTPRTSSLVVIDARQPGKLAVADTISLDGSPEGYAVDAKRGLFYTNLEDKDRTVVVDVAKRAVVATWKPDCGEEGPRGLALDPERRHLFVACTTGLKTLNAGGDGAILGELSTGAGVDNIDYLASAHRVYVASGKEARLTVAEAAADGKLKVSWSRATVSGCRTVVIDSVGVAYLPESRGGRLVIARP